MNIVFVSMIISLVLTYVERVELVSRFITEGGGGEEPDKGNNLCPSICQSKMSKNSNACFSALGLDRDLRFSQGHHTIEEFSLFVIFKKMFG